MKTTTLRGHHAATFARLFCLLKSRVKSCFRRRRRRRRWRARSRRHRRTRHSIHIIFFLVSVLSKTFFCCCDTSVSQKTSKKKNKKRAKKTKEEQTRDKKKSICQKKTQRKQDQRDHLIRKDLKVLSSEEGRAGHLISSLSVLVVISNNDAQSVVCDRKEEKAEGERKRRRC